MLRTLQMVVGSAPGATVGGKLKLAALRALRTFLQGLAGAFPAAGAGTVVLDATYWRTFGYSVLAAGIAGIVSFIQNAARILPEDLTQQTVPPAPQPQPVPNPVPPTP